VRTRRLAPLLLLSAALPGCYVVRVAVPLDPSGMQRPADWASEALADQRKRTAARITGFPAALDRHCAEGVRNLTHDPADLEAPPATLPPSR